MDKSELMQKIAEEVRICVKCPLWVKRENAVPGEGSNDASVVLVGEAPGYWEDVKGIPFVGAAGKVLDGLLEWIGLPRKNVFITNVVKCRPPENRDPQPFEIVQCTSLYLDRQISLIQPDILVTLGRHSTAHILSKAGFENVDSIAKFRGQVYDVNLLGLSLSVVPMFHPASVLHDPKYRDELENDFRFLKAELQRRRILR